MTRITIKDLQAVVDRLNRATGNPLTYSHRDENDRFVANVGNYHLDQAYSGVTLSQVMNEGGGITHPLGFGYHTRRECYELIHAFLRGIESVQHRAAA